MEGFEYTDDASLSVGLRGVTANAVRAFLLFFRRELDDIGTVVSIKPRQDYWHLPP